MLSEVIRRFNRKYLSTINKDNNILYSPYGIATALSIVANGTGEETKRELLNALCCDVIPNEEFGDYQKYLNFHHDNHIFMMSSNILLIGQKNIAEAINRDFIRMVFNTYRSDIREADFTNLEVEQERIMAWVDEKTQHIIPNYQPLITAEAQLDFLNVVCFKGEWEFMFAEGINVGNKSTQMVPVHIFSNKDGTESNIRFMSKEFHRSIPYYEDDRYHGIALPYRQSLDEDKMAVAMYIVMPKEATDRNIADEWANETTEYQNRFLRLIKDNFDSDEDITIDVHLPKFEIYTTNNLKHNLMEMGVKLAFNDSADFGSMIDCKKFPDGLKIGDIRHQAKIMIDEKGTEAAAATEMIMMAGCLSPSILEHKTRYIEFHAYRPFLFIIQDLVSGIDLFTGVVNKL